ncbi:hypothetical protein FKP32DRAFT_1643924 [Trametes sanguinea]|nr:hypothetical protein FKP32DRAFT_1643924 [Trametes sanguinea]
MLTNVNAPTALESMAQPPTSATSPHPSALSTATSHPPCCICERTSFDAHMGGESANKFFQGEVFSIKESIFTPIEHILANPEVSGLKGEALDASRASLKSFRTRLHATYKLRPCVLMDTVLGCPLERIIDPLICLMGTFAETPFEELPRVLRFFSISVYPNLVHPTPGLFKHIHSLPPWPRFKKDRYQLIVAWPFETTRKLLGRWLTPAAKRKRMGLSAAQRLPYSAPSLASPPQREGMAFGKHAMRELLEVCNTLRVEWMRKCQENEKFAAEHEAEYRAWLKAKKDELAKPEFSLGGDTIRSHTSAARRKSAPPSRYGRSVLSMPIIEGRESVFHAKLSGHDAATSQKAPSVSRGPHKSLETCSLQSASRRFGRRAKKGLKGHGSSAASTASDNDAPSRAKRMLSTFGGGRYAILRRHGTVEA